MKVAKKVSDEIAVWDLKDGEVAVIVNWNGMYAGEVVQRWGDHLINLGSTVGMSWPDWFKPSHDRRNGNLTVQILPKGTHIEV